MSNLVEKLRKNLLIMNFTERCSLVKEAADEIESLESQVQILTGGITDLRAEVEQLKQAQQWQPIETAPELVGCILARDIQGNPAVIRRTQPHHVWIEIGSGFAFYPVLFTPLPNPPTGGEK